MDHRPSPDDQRFRQQFESFAFPVEEFNHRAHIRLAYIYLCEHDVDTTYQKIRLALLGYLSHHGVDPSKYHETMTKAWTLAVRHFMESTFAKWSADSFIDANPTILDTEIMMTHYTEDVLFSDSARREFVEPNVGAIPRYET